MTDIEVVVPFDFAGTVFYYNGPLDRLAEILDKTIEYGRTGEAIRDDLLEYHRSGDITILHWANGPTPTKTTDDGGES